MTTLHATTVAIGDAGVLLTGPSGAGKSDLALRLIDRGARLVSDDYTMLTVTGDRLIAAAPPTIRGRIELRGLGLFPLASLDRVAIALHVTLGPPPDRLPTPTTREIAGIAVPAIILDPRPASAAIALEWALRAVTS